MKNACETMRDDLHIAPADAQVQAHLAACAACATYAQRFARLDQVLRGELIAQAPANVSAHLHATALAPTRSSERVDQAIRAELMPVVPETVSDRLLALVPQPRSAAALDHALRDALVVQAPLDLSARLQALIPHIAVAPPVAAPRPRRAVVATVYAVTTLLLLLAITVAGQLYGLVLAQLDLSEWLARLATLPGDLLTQLYAWSTLR